MDKKASKRACGPWRFCNPGLLNAAPAEPPSRELQALVGVLEETADSHPYLEAMNSDSVTIVPILAARVLRSSTGVYSLPARFDLMCVVQSEEVVDRDSGFGVACEIVAEIDFGIESRCRPDRGAKSHPVRRGSLSGRRGASRSRRG